MTRTGTHKNRIQRCQPAGLAVLAAAAWPVQASVDSAPRMRPHWRQRRIGLFVVREAALADPSLVHGATLVPLPRDRDGTFVRSPPGLASRRRSGGGPRARARWRPPRPTPRRRARRRRPVPLRPTPPMHATATSPDARERGDGGHDGVHGSDVVGGAAVRHRVPVDVDAGRTRHAPRFPGHPIGAARGRRRGARGARRARHAVRPGRGPGRLDTPGPGSGARVRACPAARSCRAARAGRRRSRRPGSSR